jgi:hypothetical protein
MLSSFKQGKQEDCALSLYDKNKENQWYIDSGCFKHMT